MRVILMLVRTQLRIDEPRKIATTELKLQMCDVH